MDDLYLKQSRLPGMGNVICNIILILNENFEQNLFKKLYIVFDRDDSPVKFCKIIKNDKLEFMESLNTNRNLSTIKNYRHRLSFPENKIDDPNVLTKIKPYLDLEPNDILKKKMDNYKLRDNYIALHVRTTDFETDILKKEKNSTDLSNYYNFVDKFNDLKIWLATDNEYIQKKFIEKYNDRVIFYENITDEHKMKARYTSPESIFIDLFMCSKSKYFLGTYRSTFTKLIQILRFNNNI